MTLIYKKIHVTTMDLDGFICNKCKKEYHKIDDIFEFDEMFIWNDIGGYSSIWGDGTEYEVVLCQTCAYNLFKDIATIKDHNEEYN